MPAIPSTYTSPIVRELKPGFGVEVQGLDLSDGATEESYRLIEELVKKVNLLQPFAIQPGPPT